MSRIGAIVTLLTVGLASAAEKDGEAVYLANCSICHDRSVARAAPLDALRAMSARAVLQAVTSGPMQPQAESLTDAERRLVAEFIAGKAIADEVVAEAPRCSDGPAGFSPVPGSSWNGWGAGLTNARFQPTAKAGVTADNVSKLELRWAFGVPGAAVMYGQPTVVGGRVFIGTARSRVHSLDAKTGCSYWSFDTSAAVRSAPVLGRIADRNVVFFGDRRAYVYALDARTGELLWRTLADEQARSRITGGITLYKGRLFVPITGGEEGPSLSPDYECCKQRGAVVALDAKDGSIVWHTYSIPDEAKPRGKNSSGTRNWGPSGAGVWCAPTVDEKLNLIYVGTGDNHSTPASETSDAVMALDVDTGEVAWIHQFTPGDAFNISCIPGYGDIANCPDPEGPDADVANSPILVEMPSGRRLLLVGQKSGEIHAIDLEDREVAWTHRIGKGGYVGGVQWGPATDGEAVYVALSDLTSERVPGPDGKTVPRVSSTIGGGLWAFKISTGQEIWAAPPAECPPDRKGCSPAQSAAVSVVPGVVFSGAVDGHLRGYSTKDGSVIWDYDTVREYETVNGVPGRGGALNAAGPTIVDGMLFVNSGYGSIPGNVLLAFGLPRGP